jgi:hypothetical protein
MVVDGRQQLYSSGATFAELAELMKSRVRICDGWMEAVPMVIKAKTVSLLFEFPIDTYIPRERPRRIILVCLFRSSSLRSVWDEQSHNDGDCFLRSQ